MNRTPRQYRELVEVANLKFAPAPDESETAQDTPAKKVGPEVTAIHGITIASAIGALFRISDIARWLAVDAKTVKRMLMNGRFPKPDLPVGRRSPRWRQATLESWSARSQDK
jgi:predicted DNA-binding transcriptional regulator AlpA